MIIVTLVAAGMMVEFKHQMSPLIFLVIKLKELMIRCCNTEVAVDSDKASSTELTTMNHGHLYDD